MKTLLVRLLGVLLLIIYTPGIYAVDDERTITSSIQKSKETTVIVNDVMYMLPEEEPSLSFSFTDTAAIYSIEAANFILTDVEGNTHQSSFRNRTINFNTVIFGEHTFIVPEVGIDYTAQVIIQYTLRSGENKILEYDIPTTFHKCNTPQIEDVTSINGTYYAGTPIDLVITNTGGNSNGWSFLWPTGLSNSPTYSFKTTSDGNIINDESFTVTVHNYAPDNETVWLSQNFNFEIYTYPQPNIESLANDKLILVDGDEQTLGINVDGGNPSTWTYEWYLNNERIDHSDAKLSIIAENKTIHDFTMHYRLVAKNSLVNSTTFSKTFDFEVCVKPMPKAELASANDIVLLHDQQYTFALARTSAEEYLFLGFADRNAIHFPHGGTPICRLCLSANAQAQHRIQPHTHSALITYAGAMEYSAGRTGNNYSYTAVKEEFGVYAVGFEIIIGSFVQLCLDTCHCTVHEIPFLGIGASEQIGHLPLHAHLRFQEQRKVAA